MYCGKFNKGEGIIGILRIIVPDTHEDNCYIYLDKCVKGIWEEAILSPIVMEVRLHGIQMQID